MVKRKVKIFIMVKGTGQAPPTKFSARHVWRFSPLRSPALRRLLRRSERSGGLREKGRPAFLNLQRTTASESPDFAEAKGGYTTEGGCRFKVSRYCRW